MITKLLAQQKKLVIPPVFVSFSSSFCCYSQNIEQNCNCHGEIATKIIFRVFTKRKTSRGDFQMDDYGQDLPQEAMMQRTA